jgi:hypothetical protein
MVVIAFSDGVLDTVCQRDKSVLLCKLEPLHVTTANPFDELMLTAGSGTVAGSR